MTISFLHAKLTNIASCHLLVLIILLQLPSLIHATRIMNTHKKIPAIYFFGDSILDTGNNNVLITTAKANSPPYGKDFKDHKATGRFSNGKLTTDFVAAGLGVKELVPPYRGTKLGRKELLTGVCFASAGSGYDPDTAKLMAAMTPSVQLDFFKDYKKKIKAIIGDKTEQHIQKSLYIISGGSNDVVQYFVNPFKHLAMKKDKYAKLLTEKMSTFVQNLVSLGAKKIGIVGIPPTGCIPFVRTIAGGLKRECAAEYNELAKISNSQIQEEIQKLNGKYRINGTLIIFIDLYPMIEDMIIHPMNYGFKDSNSSCCGEGRTEAALLCNKESPICSNSSDYLFWDKFHPSERGSQALVEILLEKYEKYLFM